MCGALSNYEILKLDQKESRDETAEAFTSREISHQRQENKRRLASKKRLDKDECAYCREKGHWKNDCPKLGKSTANLVEKPELEDLKIVLSVSSSVNSSKGWILDSGCSYHMCQNRQWFSSLEEFNGEFVRMGNDSTCQIKGLGTIRLQMHDGTIRRLTGVRYVPELKNNLISLGVLDSSGYKVIVVSGVMKIVRSAVLAIRGIQKGNLYFFDGHTIVGRTSFGSDM